MENRLNSWLIGGCPRAGVKISVETRVRVVQFLVDTGSQVSIISYRIVKELGLEVIESPQLRLKAANGMGVHNYGNVMVDIELWGKVLKGVGLVVTKTDGVCILGMNILAMIEYSNWELGSNQVDIHIGCDIRSRRKGIKVPIIRRVMVNASE